jgi:hypothetical protein
VRFIGNSRVGAEDYADWMGVPRERFLPSDRGWSAYAEIEPEIAGERRLMLARDLSKLLMALERLLALD